MGLNLSKAFLPNAKALIVIALATSLVVFGETMPTNADVEVSAASRSPSGNGHVRASNDETADDEDRQQNLSVFAEDMAIMSKKIIPVDHELDQIRTSHKKFMPDDQSPKIALDDYAHMANVLLTTRNNPSLQHYSLSVSDRWLDQWLIKQVTPKTALERLKLVDKPIDRVFEDPLMIIMVEFANKYAAQYKNVDPEDVLLTALATSSDRSRLLEHSRTKAREDPTSLAARLYNWQLHNWKSPGHAISELKINIAHPFRNPLTLDVLLDFLKVYMSKLNASKNPPTEQDLLDQFYAKFGYQNTILLKQRFEGLRQLPQYQHTMV